MAAKRVTELDPAGPLTGNELVELVQDVGGRFESVQSPLLEIVQQLALQGPQGPQGANGAQGPQGPQGTQGPQGATGQAGAPGGDGDNGWSPVLAVVNDGARRVLQLTAWTGGEGNAPATGQYIGSTGLVVAIADAIDVRGPAGPQGAQGAAGPQGAQGQPGEAAAEGDDGWSPVFALVNDGARRVLQVSAWTGGTGASPATGKYLGLIGFVDAIADGIDVRGPQGVQGTQGPAGADGPQGPAGAPGADGADGQGMPTGGTAGQALTKVNNTDYSTQWSTIDKGFVGLGNVNNTADADKAVSSATQTALDAKSAITRTINTQTDNYTLALADAGNIVEMNTATAKALTVPPNSSVAFPIGTQIDVVQYGAGQITVAAGSGVTIRSSGGKLKLTGQYSGSTLCKRATNEWVLLGDIAA